MIHIGNTDDGTPVMIPVFHTGIFGMSGIGKTTLLKYMLKQAKKEGFRVIIFDSKLTGEEFKGIGHEIPFYLEQSTDADVLMSLLEDVRKRRGNYNWARGGFLKICEDTKTFEDVEKNLARKLEETHGKTNDMYFEISKDFEKLRKLIQQFEFSKSPLIDNSHDIFRMPTTLLPNVALQGLVVKSTIDWILPHQSHLIVLLDEATNFAHQKRFNPAKQSIQDLDAQGRSKGLFGWYSSQNLTGFDKANMKNLWYWALGRQKEGNEVKDSYETLSHKIVSKDEIKTLPVGTFLVDTPDQTFKVNVPFEGVTMPKLGDVPVSLHQEEDWQDVYDAAQRVIAQ